MHASGSLDGSWIMAQGLIKKGAQAQSRPGSPHAPPQAISGVFALAAGGPARKSGGSAGQQSPLKIKAIFGYFVVTLIT